AIDTTRRDGGGGLRHPGRRFAGDRDGKGVQRQQQPGRRARRRQAPSDRNDLRDGARHRCEAARTSTTRRARAAPGRQGSPVQLLVHAEVRCERRVPGDGLPPEVSNRFPAVLRDRPAAI
ncbi:MAG: hypothetical protein AVDCRST_MAG85-2497, partial [uncultured Solirubrobacteraceae bacterium]